MYLEERSIYDPGPNWLATYTGDGIISKAAYPELADVVKSLGVPAVDLNEQLTDLGLPRVHNDNRMIGNMAAEHLLDRGYEHYGFVGYPSIFWSEERREGFEQVLADQGNACQIFQGSATTPQRYQLVSWEADHVALAEWIAQQDKPLGIFAANDFIAVRVLDACREAGVGVPEEVAVVGVDDETVATYVASPQLTTVCPDAFGVGYRAAATLDRLMRGEEVEESTVVIPPVELIARHSTDAIAIADLDIRDALQFINKFACDGINVNDVIDAVECSRSVLQRKFRRLLGRTLHDEILRVRMNAVKALLINTELTLPDIADRVGVPHSEYLSAQFRKLVGMTVTDFRQSLHRPSIP